jgi:hypothetical protein
LISKFFCKSALQIDYIIFFKDGLKVRNLETTKKGKKIMGLLIIRLITFLNSQAPETTNYHIAMTMLANYSNLHLISIG